MFSKQGKALAMFGLGAVFLALAIKNSPADGPAGEPVKIGMIQSFFVDVPQNLIDWLSQPFGALMKEHTGLEGKLVIGGDYYHVGKMLNDKKLQLGVFHGFEFAWAQQKFPELCPLMIAIYKHHELRANLVVRDDSKVAGFSDIRGKTLALPFRSKGYCRLYLERRCAEGGQCEPKAFFSQITVPDSVLDALDNVLDGQVQAALVDKEFMETYGRLKPSCLARLKVVKQSEAFPCSVIAYRQGALEEAILARFRDGMIKANQTIRGRDMMSMFKISAFEPIPSNYKQMLADIMKAYPPPGSAVERTSAKTEASSN